MKNRFYPFAIHLSLSLIIAAIALVVVFLIWYPSPLDKALGVGGIFLLLLGVDIIIGPIITLIIYKPKKPSLKFDLSVIALLQLAALSYGMHTIYQGRPAFIVFSNNRFEIARACDIDPGSAETAVRQGNQAAVSGPTGPAWVGALPSKDRERNNQILFSAIKGGPDWPLLPELYVPLTQVKTQILGKAKPLQELRELLHKRGEETTPAVLEDDKLKWLPMKGKVRNMVVLVDPDSADIIKIVDINPWN